MCRIIHKCWNCSGGLMYCSNPNYWQPIFPNRPNPAAILRQCWIDLMAIHHSSCTYHTSYVANNDYWDALVRYWTDMIRQIFKITMHEQTERIKEGRIKNVWYVRRNVISTVFYIQLRSWSHPRNEDMRRGIMWLAQSASFGWWLKLLSLKMCRSLCRYLRHGILSSCLWTKHA